MLEIYGFLCFARYRFRIEDLIQERDKVYKFADVCQLLGLPRDSTEEALKKWYVVCVYACLVCLV